MTAEDLRRFVEAYERAWRGAGTAIEGPTAVARVEVRYDGPPAREYRDLWIVTLDDDGRCRAFEEWPFWPERPLVPGPGRGADPGR